MIDALPSRLRIFHLVGFLALLQPGALRACDFCNAQDRTLTRQISESSLVLFGTLGKASQESDTTEFQIETVIKSHEAIGDKKVVALARYIPVTLSPAKAKDGKYLVLCDVFKGKVDPLFLIPCKADSEIAKYLKGVMETKGKESVARLGFFYPYLENAEPEIALDAFKEFANASNKEIAQFSKSADPDKLTRWIEDVNTRSLCLGVYGMMLGYCGKESHAKRLRVVLDDPKRRLSGADGLMAGYVLMSPEEGWKYVCALLKDDKKEFMARYNGLRAVRFIHNDHPEKIGEKEIIAGLKPLLDQSDIADLAIEDLRKWKCWEMGDVILGLYGKKSHDIPIIRRSILRYALQCPSKKAKDFVDAMRDKDKQMVEDAEDLLKLENPAKAVSP